MQVKSINTAINVLVAGIIVFTVAIGVWWVSNDTHETVFEEESRAMENVVKQTMAALDGYIDQNESMVRMLAQQKVVVSALKWNDPYGADLLFKDLLASSGNYWAAFVFDKDGQVIAGYNAKGKSLAGADRKSRNYARAVLEEKSDVFISDDILISKSGDGIMIFAASAVVRDEAGEVIGGVGLFPKWEGFTASFVDPFRVGKHGYGFMLDATGRIIAHGADKSLLMKNVSDSGFVQDALAQGNGELAYDWKGEQKIMRFMTEPRTGWVVAITTYESDMTAAANAQRNALALGGGVVALLLTGIMIIIIRKLVTTPVKHVLEFATAVAEGDLHATLKGDHRFEFESLAKQIQIMVHELKVKLGFSEGVLNGFSLPCGLIGPDFKVIWTNQHALDLFERDGEPSDAVGMSSGELLFNKAGRETISDRAIKQKKAFDQEIDVTTVKGNVKNLQITSTPFYDMDGEMLGSLTIWVDVTEIRSQQRLIEKQNGRISRAAGEAESISQALSGAATELLAQIDNASNGSETQRERAAETATAMEQMNSTVLEVAQNASAAAEDAFTAKANAEEGSDIVKEVITAVSDVQGQTEGLKQSMEDLGIQASDIGNVLEVITDIADQTNLLALNAAIEAARAGEAGRGFAVVADEVRKLAEKTMAATGEVEQVINTIQGMTRSNVRATEQAAQSVSRSTELANDSGRALQEIVGRVENAADQVRAIATAAEEQSATSEQINRATDEINQISIETSRIMNEAASAIQEVAEMASRLNSVIEDMAAR